MESQKKRLEEGNIALKVLLEQRVQDKTDLEQNVLSNLKEQVFPYLEKLNRAGLRPKEKKIVAIISEHLEDVVSPFLSKLSTANILLTPQEIKVASLVKDGRASKWSKGRGQDVPACRSSQDLLLLCRFEGICPQNTPGNESRVVKCTRISRDRLFQDALRQDKTEIDGPILNIAHQMLILTDRATTGRGK